MARNLTISSSSTTVRGVTPNERLVEAYELGWRVTDQGVALKPDGSVQPVNADASGYLRFSVKLSDEKVRGVYVHRLMAYQKFGKSLFEAGIEVRHLKGLLDNSRESIEIGTKAQNERDKPPEIRSAIAGRAARKLSDAQVAQLRQDREAGASYKELEEKYGIRKSTISYIVRGLTCKPDSLVNA